MKKQDRKNFFRQYYLDHKKEIDEYQRAYYLKTKRKRKNVELLRDFNITLEQYEAQLKIQGGVCACCGDPPAINKMLDVDHDHTDGRVRALLCNPCNRGIAGFKENIERMLAGIYYLQHIQHPDSPVFGECKPREDTTYGQLSPSKVSRNEED